MKTDNFDYTLPHAAIAQHPARPRDSARLLDTRDMSDHRFSDLASLLRPGDLVVVNDTKVRAARLVGRKVPTGGAVEVLLLDRREDGLWEALVRPARRIHEDTVMQFGGLSARVVVAPTQGRAVLRLDADEEEETAIERHGAVPLPPYITATDVPPDEYQTVFARRLGSAAAPTAGLHFTENVLSRLSAAGVAVASVELSVGIDTFRPIVTEEVEDHPMHSERYEVPDATAAGIDRTRQDGGRIVAIGTTAVRTLEAAGRNGNVRAGTGSTDLFIMPGYRFRIVDVMVTNFHVPRSSLIVMVAAMLGERWRGVYEEALLRGYRFLSFGDAMLVEGQ